MPPENFCVEHQQVWFKSGKMKSYAHPIKDESGITSGWCNKPTEGNPPLVKEAEKLGAKPKTPKDNPKNRAFALSYSKDIAVAKIAKGIETSLEQTIEVTKRFCKYLDTGE